MQPLYLCPRLQVPHFAQEIIEAEILLPAQHLPGPVSLAHPLPARPAVKSSPWDLDFPQLPPLAQLAAQAAIDANGAEALAIDAPLRPDRGAELCQRLELLHLPARLVCRPRGREPFLDRVHEGAALGAHVVGRHGDIVVLPVGFSAEDRVPRRSGRGCGGHLVALREGRMVQKNIVPATIRRHINHTHLPFPFPFRSFFRGGGGERGSRPSNRSKPRDLF